MPRPAVRRLLAVVLAAAAAGAPGCRDGSPATPGPSPSQAPALDALSAAIGRLNTTRRALLDTGAGVVAGFRAVDAADEAAAAGDRARVTAVQPQVAAATSATAGSLARLPATLKGYADALDALARAAAGAGLDQAQNRAVGDVVRAGRVEHAATTRFSTAAHRAWPLYRQLLPAQQTWLRRARAGWYRNADEAADAYAVLVSDDRPALDAAREALQAADTARVTETTRTSAAIERARRALAALVG